MSTIRRSLPKLSARAPTPVSLLVKFIVWAMVTDWGADATPSAATPLSAQKTATQALSILFIVFPVIPAILMEISSSPPRDPGGFARVS